MSIYSERMEKAEMIATRLARRLADDHNEREDLIQAARIDVHRFLTEKPWRGDAYFEVVVKNALLHEKERSFGRHRKRSLWLSPVIERSLVAPEESIDPVIVAYVKRQIEYHGSAREALYRAVTFAKRSMAKNLPRKLRGQDRTQQCAIQVLRFLAEREAA